MKELSRADRWDTLHPLLDLTSRSAHARIAPRKGPDLLHTDEPIPCQPNPFHIVDTLRTRSERHSYTIADRHCRYWSCSRLQGLTVSRKCAGRDSSRPASLLIQKRQISAVSSSDRPMASSRSCCRALTAMHNRHCDPLIAMTRSGLQSRTAHS